MDVFTLPVQIRWSDLDPNFHLRHSVYYDWGAMCRVAFLENEGLNWQRMHQLQVGPIIFREECIFKKEIRLGDTVNIDLKLLKARKDFSRFTIQHQIMKSPETISAIITVDIAWINGLTRKLTVLPQEHIDKLLTGPFAENFQWID